MNYEYSEKEFLSAKNKIISSLTKNVYPNNMPQAFLLGGQPGAGKTGLQYIIKQQLADSQNIIIINGDAYRIYHPRINEIEINGDDLAISTQEFVHKMTESIISDLSNKKYNLIIEGTLRTVEVPEKTSNMLKNIGYITNLYVIAVNREKSWNSTINRYNEMKKQGLIPRATTKEHHDLVCNNICKNLDELQRKNIFNCIKIYNRKNELLYDSLNDSRKASSVLSPILNGKEKLLDLPLNICENKTLCIYNQKYL